MDSASRRAALWRVARGNVRVGELAAWVWFSFVGRRVFIAGQLRSLDGEAHSIAPPKRYLVCAD
jgi:hypothetical protein